MVNKKPSVMPKVFYFDQGIPLSLPDVIKTNG